jgi:hypothetical protein
MEEQMAAELPTSFILSAPQCSGKSTYAKYIRDYLKLDGIIDEWDGTQEIPPRHLVLTNGPVQTALPDQVDVLELRDEDGTWALIAALERAASLSKVQA